MPYKLEFLPSALKEWNKLGSTIQQQLKKKLRERLETPRVVSASLHGMPDHYKIKLRQLGYRLVYSVNDDTVTVLVVAVGKRERGDVYNTARSRTQKYLTTLSCLTDPMWQEKACLPRGHLRDLCSVYRCKPMKIIGNHLCFSSCGDNGTFVGLQNG